MLFGFGVFLYDEFWSAHKKGEGAAVIDRGVPVAEGAPASLYVSLPAVAGSLGLIVILLVVKVAAKFAGVWPVARLFNYSPRESMYTTLGQVLGFSDLAFTSVCPPHFCFMFYSPIRQVLH